MSTEELFERHGPAYRWWATATVTIASIAVVLSTTIVNVAIPDVMGAFGISQVEAQWIATGFLAAMTATMLLTDWVEKSFGLRAGINGALMLFLAGSLIGGVAGHEHVVTIARVIQGAAAGVVQPLSMILLFQVFPPHQRGTATGIFGIGVVLAPALGPWVGGVLIDTFNWHYVFFLGIPFALLGVLLSNLFLPTRTTTGPRPRFDWLGMGLLCVFLGTLLSGLSNAQRLGWDSDFILGLFVVAFLAAAAFLAWELHVDKPMLDLKVFTHLPFLAAAMVSFIMGAGLFGSTYLLPLFVQTVQGYTPTQAGLLLMPAGFILVLLFPLAGYLADRMSAGLLIGVGMLVFAWASYLMAGLSIHTSFAALAWWAVLSRVGLGIVFPALTASSLRVLPHDMMGQGSGSINFMRQLGGAFGINLLAVLLERRVQFHADALAASQTPGHAPTLEFLERVARGLQAAGMPDPEQLPAALAVLAQAIVSEANTLAFHDGFLAAAVVFLLALGPTWLMHRALRRPMPGPVPT